MSVRCHQVSNHLLRKIMRYLNNTRTSLIKVTTASLFFRILTFSIMYFLTPFAHAANHAFIIKTSQTDQAIEQLYHKLHNKPISNFTQRISFISAQFLGKPYENGPLGEGLEDEYDQFPLYRMDAFDCVTYVETVLALSFANNLQEFKQYIRRIRYQKGHVSFIHRNHFTDLDWNQNIQRSGMVKDITRTIKNKQQQSVFKMAKAYIDKNHWYQHFSLDKIRLQKHDRNEQTRQLIRLKQLGTQLQGEMSYLPYIPLSALFDANGRANLFLFRQIPDAAIIEIVRPNWDVAEKIGTRMNVSHLGFAIWKNHTLFFREASSNFHQVTDTPFIDYLRQILKSPTIRGINIQTTVPPPPIIATF